MPLTFANPLLLFGALAAAVPLLIHLLNRRRARRLPFSDLRFLAAAETQQARSNALRRLLLLLLRVLAILLIVLAAAGPRWGVAGAGGARSLLIVLDASASMQTHQEGGTRFDEARAVAAEAIAGLPDGSEVQVLVGGYGADALFSSWLPASAVAEGALDDLRSHDGTWALAASLREAADWAGRARLRPMDLLLLSDFQRQLADTAAAAAATGRLAASDRIRGHWRRTGEAVANGGILDLRSPSRALREGETIGLRAEARLHVDRQQFFLDLDGRRVGEVVAEGRAGELVGLDFVLAAPEAGLHRAVVHTASDRLPVDDLRPCVIEVRDRIRVLLVHGADRREVAGRGGWRYLDDALRVTEQSAGADTLFSLRSVETAAFAAGDLLTVDLLLLVDPDPLGRVLLDDVTAWLEAGGAAALWLGDPDRAEWYGRNMLPVLGLPPGAPVRALGDSWERARIVSAEHPLWSGLGDEALATMVEVPWRRYLLVGEAEATVHLRLTEGAPLLLEGRVREGRFALWTTNLGAGAGDFAHNAMFLPVMRRLASRLAGGGVSGAVDVGQVPTVTLAAARGGEASLAGAALGIVGPAPAGGEDGSDLRPARIDWRRRTPLLAAGETRRRGFYAFVADRDTLGLVAAGVPAAESESRLMSAAGIDSVLAGCGLDGVSRLDADDGGVRALLAGRDLVAPLLILAALCLLVELWLGRGAAAGGSC